MSRGKRPDDHSGSSQQWSEHPGASNYPADPPASGPSGPATHKIRPPAPDGRAGREVPPPPRYGTRSTNRHLPPLGEPTPAESEASTGGPRKVTVTRVAAMRSKQLTAAAARKVHAAATADGADRSGLTALTYPVMLNYAVDAAMAVALANTFFFASTSGDKSGVAIYLLVTIAPFALIAPIIGPALDRLQRGRRLALAGSFVARAILAILLMYNSRWQDGELHYSNLALYTCALGLMVFSKSFMVLKSAVTPRVLPPSIDLTRTNARLTTFGLVGGTIAGGAVAAGFEAVFSKLFHIPGAMLWLAIVSVVAAYLCMKIPAWVESTEGEVPTTLTYHGEPARPPGWVDEPGPPKGLRAVAAKMRQPLGRSVITGLWGNSTIRILTGFLTLYIPFYAKSLHDASALEQLLILGALGGSAGVGNFVGNAVGTRLQLSNPPRMVVWVTIATTIGAIVAAAFDAVLFAVIATFVASAASAIGKACLDASIQDDLPDESRASAFGRSETFLQLSWVIGATFGVLLPSTIWIGFTVVSVLLVVGLAQTVLSSRGSSLIPGFGGARPDKAMATGAINMGSRTPSRGAPRPPA